MPWIFVILFIAQEFYLPFKIMYEISNMLRENLICIRVHNSSTSKLLFFTKFFHIKENASELFNIPYWNPLVHYFRKIDTSDLFFRLSFFFPIILQILSFEKKKKKLIY